MGRYYNRQGIFQEGAGLREARKLDLVPSVTTIIDDMINKPFLNNWKIDQHLNIAYSLRGWIGWIDNYKEKIKEEFKNNTDAVDFGKDIHNSLENKFKYKKVKKKHLNMCCSIYEKINEITNGVLDFVGNQEVETQKTGNGYSGTIDLIVETNSRTYIFDYKTQDSEINKINKYPEWLIQLGAYADAVKLINKKPITCYNIVINRELEYKFIKYSYKDLCRGKRMFKHAFKLWQDYKKFYPEAKK